MLVVIAIVGCVVYLLAAGLLLLAWRITARKPGTRILALCSAVFLAIGLVFLWKAVLEVVLPPQTIDVDDDPD